MVGVCDPQRLDLNAWYNPGELAPALHSGVQSLIGLLVSHPLRSVMRRTWDSPTPVRVAINSIAILVASQIWTVLRLGAFTLMTGVTIGPEDWGGWIFGSLTVFASWAFCYHALKYYRQWIDQREVSIKAQNSAFAAEAIAQRETVKRLRAESLVRESKLRLLNNQLNPHFLFNALNSVTALVSRGEKHAAIEMLTKIGDFLRTSLDGDNETLHPLRDEIEITNLYLGIEKVRFGDRLTVEIAVSNEASSIAIPRLLLQPLVENSIKHAVGKSLAPATLRIEGAAAGKRLLLSVCDTGAGGGEAAIKGGQQGRGIGLKNVTERLQAVYDGDFALKTHFNDASGFCIEISVPSSTENQYERADGDCVSTTGADGA